MKGNLSNQKDYGYDYSSNYHQKEIQNVQYNSKQKIISDQNYSNQTFFMMMSTLESLVDYFTNKTNDFSNKMFKSYDKVNYSSKNLVQLKSQLSTHIFLLQASKKAWIMQNPKAEWQLPKNFSKDNALKFLQESMRIFDKKNERDCIKMCHDIKDILNNKLSGLNIDKMTFNPEYSQKQKQTYKKNILKNGIDASQSMRRLQEESKQYKEVSDLNAKINSNSSKFNQPMQVQTYSNQEIDQKYYSKHSFLIFKQGQIFQNQNLSLKLKNKYIDSVKIQFRCELIKNVDLLSHRKAQLIQGKCQIVPIKLNGNYIQEVQNWFSLR